VAQKFGTGESGMTRALVTGGGGFVGQALARALLAQHHDVIAFQRKDCVALAKLGVQVRQGDLKHAADVQQACRGVDVVYHVAARTGFAGSLEDFQAVNVAGTRHVIDACVQNQVTRLVYCSSPSVTLDGQDHHLADESVGYASHFLAHYPRTKAEGEQVLLAANGQRLADGRQLRTVALRPHLIFGPHDEHLMPRLISRARKGRLRIIGNGKNEVDWTYVDNVAHAHLCAAEALRAEDGCAAGKPYFITNGEPVNAWSWFNDILQKLGMPPLQRKVPLAVARRIGRIMDSTWRTFSLSGEPPLTEFAAVQVATTHTYSIENARRDLGYEPKVSLDEGVKRTIPWLEQQLADGRFG
jgi:nucleoside-diphosphate-sugar epimerase